MKQIKLNEFPYFIFFMLIIVAILVCFISPIISIFSPILSHLIAFIITVVFIQTVISQLFQFKPLNVTDLCIDEVDNEQYLILYCSAPLLKGKGHHYTYEDYVKENKHYKINAIKECYIIDKKVPFINRSILCPISIMVEIHIITDKFEDVIPVYFNSNPVMKIKEIKEFLQTLPNYTSKPNTNRIS